MLNLKESLKEAQLVCGIYSVKLVRCGKCEMCSVVPKIKQMTRINPYKDFQNGPKQGKINTSIYVNKMPQRP